MTPDQEQASIDATMCATADRSRLISEIRALPEIESMKAVEDARYQKSLKEIAAQKPSYRYLYLKMQIVRAWISAMKGVQIVNEYDAASCEAACELERLIDVGNEK